MDAYLDEMLETNLHTRAKLAMTLLPHPCTVENCIVTSSNGSSVTVVSKLVDYVLQAYLNPIRYDKIKQFWISLRETEDPKLLTCVAPILDFYDTEFIIKVKKVAPLDRFGAIVYLPGEGVSQIDRDITYAIEYLGEYGLSQGDPRLSNIGQDLDTQRWVLFDYDYARNDVSIDAIIRDLDTFKNSLKWATE
jgi:hypothetical protein